MSPFTTLNVSNKQTRTLRVYRHDDVLECNLETISLADSHKIPEYDAISWCWGSSKNLKAVKVGDTHLSVRTNAVHVLDWIQAKGMKRVWMDAVCINQNDIDERSSQVMLMQEIYSNAAKVHIILDLHADDVSSIQAAKSIRTLVGHAHKITGGAVDFESNPAHKHGQKFPSSIDWVAINKLFSAPWFTRLWVFQEVALARSAICHFGAEAMAWSELILAARWLSHLGYWDHMSAGPGPVGIDNCGVMAARIKDPGTTFHLLVVSRCFDSTDPRDKIYGMLGLRGRIKDAQPIVPDYRKSVVEVYIEATRATVLETKGLAIIAQANSLDVPHMQGAPSWLPRYDGIFKRLGRSYRLVRTSAAFGASDNMKVVLNQDINPEVGLLDVKGVTVDHVKEVSQVFREGSFYRKDFLDEMRKVWIWASAAIGQSRSTEDVERVLVDTLTTGPLDADEASEVSRTQLFRFGCFLRCLGLKDDLDTSQQLQAGDGRLSRVLLEGYEAYRASMRLNSVNRAFFTTVSGFIGMGPCHIQPGNEVSILYGARAAFILRKDEDVYNFVGDAWVHGIMKVSRNETIVLHGM